MHHVATVYVDARIVGSMSISWQVLSAVKTGCTRFLCHFWACHRIPSKVFRRLCGCCVSEIRRKGRSATGAVSWGGGPVQHVASVPQTSEICLCPGNMKAFKNE